MSGPTNASFYQKQLDRFLEKWHVAAQIYIHADDVSYPIRLHVGKYREEIDIGDVGQRRRNGIISMTDLLKADVASYPQEGDKISYLDQSVTIDSVDPRVEVGNIIGYDFILRGT